MTGFTSSVQSIKEFTTSYPVYTPPVRLDTGKMPVLNEAELPRNVLMRTLGRALTLKRGHASETESAFVAWLANRLPVTMIDAVGNVHVDMRTEPAHRTMFTAHTDTVHAAGGANTVRIDGKFWRAEVGAALGADDGAGVALLCHMIEANIPGYYLFCRGEERGGIGSRWIAKNMADLFISIDRAVAFDRGGYEDVITHQGGERCCSDDFAKSLSAALSTELDWFLPSDEGVYTDTAEFTGLVSECTNVSVGYRHQHGDREELDVEFLQRLAQALTKVPWDLLPVKRDPRVYESVYDHNATTSWWNDYLTEDAPTDDVVEAMDAIDQALMGSHSWLISLIADHVNPQAPMIVENSISRARLDDETLEYAMEMLDNGWTVEQVMNELYDLSAVA